MQKIKNFFRLSGKLGNCNKLTKNLEKFPSFLLTYWFYRGTTRVCHLKRQKAGDKNPAFIDKLVIISYKLGFIIFEIYVPTFIYLYENFYSCFYVF